MTKEILFKIDPTAATEARCFFCYAKFEEGETICQYNPEKHYHTGCLKDMLVANEIEQLELQKLDGTQHIILGYQPKYRKPY